MIHDVNNGQDERRLVTASTIGRRYGLAPGTIRRWAHAGEIPVVLIRRPGRRSLLRFDVDELGVVLTPPEEDA